MKTKLTDLQPHSVWKHFSEICAIPHPSRHEEKLRAYVVNFARENGIECLVDEIGNVILRKEATPGMEQRKGIILQAHLDMVPQKNSDKTFDFEQDPIEAYVDGDWVTANATTLGADNGMGMAAILAVMGAKDLVHGPLEGLLTVAEEVGMDGAFGLKGGLLRGEILMNLDSETEGELYVGCAGGLDANIHFPCQRPFGLFATTHRSVRVQVKGLKGGHSGIEIILERGNANKILNRFLMEAAARFPLHLSAIDGGGLRNAIPREAVATVLIPFEEYDRFAELLAAFESKVKNELKGVDDGLSITMSDAPMPVTLIDADTQRRLFDAICACPNGVMRMSPSMKGVVQTSTNLARVISSDTGIDLQCLLRSSSDSEKEELAQRIRSVFELAGATVEFSGSYNGWNPNMESPILGTMIASYEALYGVRPAITSIHAGLECGILAGAYPNLDMISFGPTICFPHSPDEKVHIASVQRFWDYLVATLKNAPQ